MFLGTPEDSETTKLSVRKDSLVMLPMAAIDAVDGSTAGIAMCHGGYFGTANRGAAQDGD